MVSPICPFGLSAVLSEKKHHLYSCYQVVVRPARLAVSASQIIPAQGQVATFAAAAVVRGTGAAMLGARPQKRGELHCNACGGTGEFLAGSGSVPNRRAGNSRNWMSALNAVGTADSQGLQRPSSELESRVLL